MTSKLSIYNGALRLLGERKTTLTEDRAARRYLDDAWDDGLVDGLLEQGYWNFATRSIALPASTSITSGVSGGYQYAFEKPDDYIKTAAVCSDPFFRIPLHQYSDENNLWWADPDVLYIQYVSNDAAFGGDLSLWPQSVQKYAQALLADEVKDLVTGNDGKYERIKKALKTSRIDALGKDAMNQPVKFAPSGTWVSARMNSTVNNDRSRSS